MKTTRLLVWLVVAAASLAPMTLAQKAEPLNPLPPALSDQAAFRV